MIKWTPRRIKGLRRKYRISQIAFADMMGVTRIYIYYLERGDRKPSKTLSLLLDCAEENLMKGGRK
ncbi:MAG: helix-turn-helix transcriptional regulator [Planctomycetota bacterium]|jgi:DNA-binding transcriptional regulator YiaG